MATNPKIRNQTRNKITTANTKKSWNIPAPWQNNLQLCLILQKCPIRHSPAVKNRRRGNKDRKRMFRLWSGDRKTAISRIKNIKRNNEIIITQTSVTILEIIGYCCGRTCRY